MAGFIELPGQTVQPRDLPRHVLDGAGGLTLRAPQATQVRLSRPGLRCLDLIDSPHLEVLDLGRLRGVVHLTVRGCPALQKVVLPASGAAHVHLDAGAQPPCWLQLRGCVEQFDACWGESGRLLRRAPARTAAWRSVLFVAGAAPRPAALASTSLAGGMLVWVATQALPQQELGSPEATLDAVCIHHASPDLLALEWLGERRLREFTVEHSASLMTLRLRTSVDHLGLAHCDRLRAVTTEGRHCLQVSVRECGARLDDSGMRPAGGLGPRMRSFLTLDVPSERVMLVDAKVLRFALLQSCIARLDVIRCGGLRWMRLPKHLSVYCEGPAPLCVLDYMFSELLTVEVDESMLCALGLQVRERHPLGWKRLLRVLAWCRSPRSIAVALQVLAHDAVQAVPPGHLWQARSLLMRAQRQTEGSTRWVWHTGADLAAQAYRDDFRLYERCRSAYRNRAFIRCATLEVMREEGRQQAAALLPWLAKEANLGSGARMLCLEAVLRHASCEQTIPAHVRQGLEQSLPFLLHHLRAGSLVTILPQTILFEAARGYYARHGTANELRDWLGFELERARVPTQLQIARLLAQAPAMWEEGLAGPRRAALAALMLTGQVPPQRPSRPPSKLGHQA